MDGNGLGIGGGLFSAMGSSGTGMLGLEIPIQHQQNPQSASQNPHRMVPYGGYSFGGTATTTPAVAAISKPKHVVVSDDEELGVNADEGTSGDGKRKMSPWQRMKWTDTMVRLLIMAVFYIGDEGAPPEGPTDPKRKASVAAGGGLLQKKGKWKSVSRAMMEKGFYVSPQQCEDKFNDLNKRYKRVNDILGKGTACRVVENQSLMEPMDIAPKLKEEVRKLLNSKHLFFREMCAYHNSCGHGTSSGPHNSPEQQPQPLQPLPPPTTTNQQAPPPPTTTNQQAPPKQLQQQCFHSVAKTVSEGDEDNDSEDYEDEDDDDNESEDDHDEAEGGSHGNNYERGPRKRVKTGGMLEGVGEFRSEMAGVMEDGTRSWWEKRQWLKEKMVGLEEQQVGFQYEAFELEKQRLKWLKFSGKKERDMEKAKFENERRRLENERMVLLIRQKELEVSDSPRHHHRHNHQQQHSSNKRGGGDPSSVTG